MMVIDQGAGAGQTSTPPTRLYEPFRLGDVELRNRLYVAPHTTNFAEHNLVTDRYIDYQRARARGGAGLIITEGLRIHPSALRRFGVGGFHIDSRARFARLAEAVHSEGAKLIGQIMHTGRHDGSEFTGSWGASAIQWTAGIGIPHVMTKAEITLAIEGFRDLAAMLVESGFDGLEVHLGHGHLIQQFLSPATNARTDEYGGSLNNRMRLARDVLDAVYEAAGSAPVGIRISADEMLPGGLDVEAMIEICGMLLAEYPLAFLHVSHSAYSGEFSISTQMADMSFGTTPFVGFPAAFKAAFPEVPVLAVCRMDDVDVAERVLADGHADLIGMARPHIADPDIARKGAAGHRARSCIACNQGCVARLEKTLPIRCVVNPEVGLEREWSRVPPAPESRRVLVVGGGPAGLEAAATAARRGHRVTLAERSDRLGGQVNLIRAQRGRERFGLLTDELRQIVAAEGVEVRLGTEIGVADVVTGGWDEVVVATGSRCAPHDTVPAAHTSWEAAENSDGLGRSVLVHDEEGFWPAAGLVAHLSETGHRVRFVTQNQTPAGNIDTYTKHSLFERLSRAEVTIQTMRRLVSFEPGVGVVLADTLNGERTLIEDVADVVIVAPQIANDELGRALTAALPGTPVHVVGDAFAPRTTLEATFEGRGAGSLIGLVDVDGWNGPPLRSPYVGEGYGGDLLGSGYRNLPLVPGGRG
ncbi:MAG: NAD-binding protein [Microbacteriaceae bacterium]